MMSRFLRVATVALMITALTSVASAQSKAFDKGDRVATLGFMTGNDYDGSGFGAQVEWRLLPIGKASLGVGGFVGFQHDSKGVGTVKTTASWMPMMATANLHFPLENQPRVDLYAGASFGFVRASVDVKGAGTLSGKASDTDSGFGIQGGARYWLGSKLGVSGQVGFGDIPLVIAGLAFKF